MNINVKLNGQQQFHQAMQRMRVESKKSAFQVAQFGAGRYAISMKNIYDPNKRNTQKKRELIKAPRQKDAWLMNELAENRQRYLDILRGKVLSKDTTHHEHLVLKELTEKNILVKDAGIKKYGIEILRQNKPPKLLLTDNKNHKKLKIERRGFAKTTWSILEALVKNTKSPGSKDDKWYQFYLQIFNNNNTFKISVTNKITYLLRFDASAQTQAITSATNQINGMLDRIGKKIIASAKR